MTTPGSYFVSKFGWQEGWVNDYNKIILLDMPQKFTNNDYWELMQKMFLSTPDDGEVGSWFNKFKKSNGKFWNDFQKKRRQPNFEKDFLGRPCIYFLHLSFWVLLHFCPPPSPPPPTHTHTLLFLLIILVQNVMLIKNHMKI